jgi:hypothetical protein
MKRAVVHAFLQETLGVHDVANARTHSQGFNPRRIYCSVFLLISNPDWVRDDDGSLRRQAPSTIPRNQEARCIS